MNYPAKDFVYRQWGFDNAMAFSPFYSVKSISCEHIEFIPSSLVHPEREKAIKAAAIHLFIFNDCNKELQFHQYTTDTKNGACVIMVDKDKDMPCDITGNDIAGWMKKGDWGICYRADSRIQDDGKR